MSHPADTADCEVLSLRVECAACGSSAVLGSEALGLWTDAHWLPAVSDAYVRMPTGEKVWLPVYS